MQASNPPMRYPEAPKKDQDAFNSIAPSSAPTQSGPEPLHAATEPNHPSSDHPKTSSTAESSETAEPNGTADSTASPTPEVPLHKPGGHSSPPSLDWLSGKWHITHSTLPTWRGKKNVTITYKVKNSNKLEDNVEFQNHDGEKVKSVKGDQSPTGPPGEKAAVWDWRGKGVIKVATAHWEILGYGSDTIMVKGADGDEKVENEWVVTYFAKTVFTPEGVNVYSRHPHGITPEFLEGIRKSLRSLGHKSLDRLAGEIYETEKDGGR